MNITFGLVCEIILALFLAIFAFRELKARRFKSFDDYTVVIVLTTLLAALAAYFTGYIHHLLVAGYILVFVTYAIPEISDLAEAFAGELAIFIGVALLGVDFYGLSIGFERLEGSIILAGATVFLLLGGRTVWKKWVPSTPAAMSSFPPPPPPPARKLELTVATPAPAVEAPAPAAAAAAEPPPVASPAAAAV